VIELYSQPLGAGAEDWPHQAATIMAQPLVAQVMAAEFLDAAPGEAEWSVSVERGEAPYGRAVYSVSVVLEGDDEDGWSERTETEARLTVTIRPATQDLPRQE
jgi:hypothetical protein